ncbi:hypothetical protein Ancab_005531 [Ancistrocladus abbreviatus]
MLGSSHSIKPDMVNSGTETPDAPPPPSIRELSRDPQRRRQRSTSPHRSLPREADPQQLPNTKTFQLNRTSPCPSDPRNKHHRQWFTQDSGPPTGCTQTPKPIQTDNLNSPEQTHSKHLKHSC